VSFNDRRKREQELDDEIESHLRMAAEDHMQRGEAREEAGYAARRKLGNVGLIKEVTRDVWGGNWMGALLQDLRYGLRVLYE
jgi:putative ABC transport system permease protein